MRPIAVIGIIFIVIGIIALAYQGLTYTTKENVVDLGPLKVEAKREKTIPLPPVLGVPAMLLVPPPPGFPAVPALVWLPAVLPFGVVVSPLLLQATAAPQVSKQSAIE